MVEPGGHGLQPDLFGQRHHRFRQGIGGDVDIAHRLSQQVIAHAAADKQRLMACIHQHPANRLACRIGQPFGGDLHGAPAASASARRMRAVAPQM